MFFESIMMNSRFSSCPVKNATVTGGDVLFTIEAKRLNSCMGFVPSKSNIEFEVKESEIHLTSDRGNLEFSSLNPQGFPFWDEILSEAKETATVAADRLGAAFQHAKEFVFNDEGKAPQLCVAEFRGGCLYSSDQSVVSCIRVIGMESAAIRVHGKDIAPLVAFLNLASGQDVTILEHERAMFVRRADGAIFGMSLFGHSFPPFSVDWDIEDDFRWTMTREEFGDNLSYLKSAAAWEDHTLHLSPKGVILGMTMATAASGKRNTINLRLENSGSKDGVEPLPDSGFPVIGEKIIKAIQNHSTALVKMGASRRKNGGWVRVKDERGEGPVRDTYLTTVAWLMSKKTA